jgi:hypothetical protein
VASVDAELLGAVALGVDAVGARFAMPRADLITALETARQALQGSAGVLEAQVTAAQARQLQHSVPADRGFLARAGDQDAARRELDTALSLDWHGDRSYLWSIFVGGDDRRCNRPG